MSAFHMGLGLVQVKVNKPELQTAPELAVTLTLLVVGSNDIILGES